MSETASTDAQVTVDELWSVDVCAGSKAVVARTPQSNIEAGEAIEAA